MIRLGPGAEAYGEPGRATFAEGVLLVITLEPFDAASGATTYAMRKRQPGFFPEGGDWEYAVLDQQGQAKRVGALALCARCHAEAPREHVFEPPLAP